MRVDLRSLDSLRARVQGAPVPPPGVAPGVRPNASVGGAIAAPRAPARVAWLGIADRTGQPALSGEVRGLNELVRRSLATAGYALADEATTARIAARGSWSQRRHAAESLGVGAVIAGAATVRNDAMRADAQILDVRRGRLRSAGESGSADNPREVVAIVGEIMGALEEVRAVEAQPIAPVAPVVGAASGAARAGGHAGTYVISGRPRVILFDLEDRSGAAGGEALARAITDSLRRVVRRSGLEVVDDEVTRAVPPTTASRREAGSRYAAGAIAAGTLARRRDSLVVQMSVRDMNAGRTFERFEARVPAGAPLDAVGTLAAHLLSHLGRVNWSARLVAPPTPPAP
jgi:TolB-like protein